jgi:hypothetical protein
MALITRKDIDYKKQFYSLLNSLRKLENKCSDRCPLARNCCNGCNLIKSKVDEVKASLMKNGDWDEPNDNYPRVR